MNNRWMKMTRLAKLMIIAPMAILAMLIFTFIGGEVVKLLWNWLAPELLGLRQITFWQAFGLLALCRILFGGFGLGGGGHRSHSGRRFRGRVSERVGERMRERWEQMSPEERERFREGMRGGGRGTTPLDPNATT
jgi:hypothetical protein